MTLRVLVATVLFSVVGCSLHAGLTGGSSGPVGPKPSSGSPTPSSSSSGSTETSEVADRDRSRGPGYVHCPDRKAFCDPREPIIVGLSVEDATKRIATTNPTLEVRVQETHSFDKECKPNTVCGFEPRRWYIGDVYQVTLLINRKLDIGLPAD
jgi:hypothetical protein